MEGSQDIKATRTFKKELRQKTVAYLSAAFGLVAGLAWNDAIKALIDYAFPLSGASIWIKFLYAVIITILVVIVTYFILKSQEEK